MARLIHRKNQFSFNPNADDPNLYAITPVAWSPGYTTNLDPARSGRAEAGPAPLPEILI